MDKIPPPKKGSGKKWEERRRSTRLAQSGQGAEELVHAIDSASFESVVLKSAIPVVLEFFTVYCPPCREIEPTLDEFAREYKGRVKVARIRMDTNIEISGEFGVSVAPTLIFFNKGKALAHHLLGPVPKEAIVRELERESLL